MFHLHGPALRGGALALLAAVLFGVSTPLVQHLGAGLGAFSTAALLYAGAASMGAVLRKPVQQEARLRRADTSRLLAMAGLGAVVGPVALACARWSRMAILAPFDGTVGIRNVNLGDFVKDGADLVNLEDIGSMYADFRLPERFQGKLRARQNVQLRLDAFPGRVFKASIEAIDPLLDVNGR